MSIRRARGAAQAGAAAVAVVIAATALSACSPASGETADISIVASTDAYGSLVQELVAGLAPGRVGVTSILTDPSVDPHSYEASPRNELSISRADLIIENGGGYDDFVGTLRSAAGSGAPVIDAVRLSGHAAEPNLNEHVWYDLPTMQKLARQVTGFLLVHDRRDANILRHDARAVAGELRRLQTAERQLRAAHGGEGVAITEPVPLYLLQACGLVNRTPASFSTATEDGTDAAPRVLQTTLDLFRTHQVRVLVYNEQTAGPQTDQMIAAARQAQVPVVGVTETLPAGISYTQWMRGVLEKIAAALS